MVGTYFTSQHEEYYYKCPPCPETKAYWPSRLTFWWSHSLLALGFRKPLETTDLYQTPDYLHVANIDEMPINWSEKWPLLKALYRRYLKKFPFLPVLHFAVVVSGCITPLLVMILMIAIQSGSTSLKGPIFTNAWQVVVALAVVGIIKVTLKQQYYWWAMKAGLDFRSVFLSLVYKKALKVSLSNKKNGSAGAMTNLMASDAEAVLEFMWASVVFVVTVPIQIITLLLIAVYVIGPSGLVGFVPLVAMVPMQTSIAKRVTKMRDQAREKNDERVNLLGEIFQGIRLLKLYNWEIPFKSIIHRVRASQLALLFRGFEIELWNFFLTAALAGLALASVFATYVYSGHTLNIEEAFTILTLYQTLAEPLRHIQWVFNDWPRLIVSLRYMATFLLSDEVKRLPTSDTNEINLEGATFLWDPEPETSEDGAGVGFTYEKKSLIASQESTIIEMTDSPQSAEPQKPALDNISFQAPHGKLTCVVGPVGCGKSALLHALLGELPLQSGTAVIPSDVAYTPQTPWLITATLRENITFGKPMDQKRYDATLAACALGKDLTILPSGDLTEIGEKGINLSGGQKQRVSLARALYSNAQCFLLDEPLSAVDMHVASWLFDNCINGMMANRTRILVTHQIQFLSRADLVIVMEGGQITHRGTYEQLVRQGIDFESLINKKSLDEVKKADKSENAEEKTDKQASNEVDEITTENQKVEKPGIIEDEERQIGKVKWQIYKEYFRATGQIWLPIITLFVYILYQTTNIILSYWLTFWAGDTLGLSTHIYLTVFVAILVTYGLLMRLGLHFVLAIVRNGASTLHNRMLDVVMNAKPNFFDMTPTGRILNRFSKDQNTLDQRLLLVLHEILECFIMAFCSVVTVCIVAPIMIPIVIALGILFYFIQHYYRSTIRELKRLNSMSFSGIFSVATESMGGLSVIRAFKHQQTFTAVFNAKLNANCQFMFNEFCVNRWLDTQLEWIAVLVVFFSSASAVYMLDSIGPGLAALVITSSLSTCGSLTWGVRQFSELEVQMSSVERILYYCTSVPQEPTTNKTPPPKSWPEQGALDVKDLVVKYRPDLDPVLRGVTFSIKAGEKVGVVGRTGAGKSTVTSAIFRMVDAASGSICIDGVNIYDVNLDVLRSGLSIIPQDPIVFSGTIRMNLDPFGKHSDAELWSVLKQVHLEKHVSHLPDKLAFCFKNNGEGFSVGQRQLLCIGRAILRHAKILVMDEATASLDFNTDVLIKQTVRECFASKTTITIAHRLDTIMDSDRVLVFDLGELKEFDKPSTLLANPSSRFSLLVAAAQKSFKQSSH